MKLIINDQKLAWVFMSIYNPNFTYRHGKMTRYKFEDAGIGHIALRFFAHGNFKMVLRLLGECFFPRPCGDFHVYVAHP